jgi:hypothetical protein
VLAMSAAADRPMGRGDITGRDAIPDDVHCWLGALERNKANRAEELDPLVRAQMRRLSATRQPAPLRAGSAALQVLPGLLRPAGCRRPTTVAMRYARSQAAFAPEPDANRHLIMPGQWLRARGPAGQYRQCRQGLGSASKNSTQLIPFAPQALSFAPQALSAPTRRSGHRYLRSQVKPLDNVEHMRIASGALTSCESTDGGSMDRRPAWRPFTEPPRQGRPPTARNSNLTVLLGLVAAAATFLSVTSVALPRRCCCTDVQRREILLHL